MTCPGCSENGKCLRDGCVKCCYCDKDLLPVVPTRPDIVLPDTPAEFKRLEQEVAEAIRCILRPFNGLKRVYGTQTVDIKRMVKEAVEGVLKRRGILLTKEQHAALCTVECDTKQGIMAFYSPWLASLLLRDGLGTRCQKCGLRFYDTEICPDCGEPLVAVDEFIGERGDPE